MVTIGVKVNERDLPAAAEGVSPLNAAIEGAPGAGQIITMTMRRRDGQIGGEVTLDMPSPAAGGLIAAWNAVPGLEVIP